MDDIINKIEELKLSLDDLGDRYFLLAHGEDISEIIKRLKTDNDVVLLAKRIIDGTIPGTEIYEEFKVEKELFKETNDEYIDDETHSSDLLLDEIERVSSDEASIDYIVVFRNILDERDIIGDWPSWKELLTEFGYDKMASFSGHILINCLDNIIENDWFLCNDKEISYFTQFIDGELSDKQIMEILDCHEEIELARIDYFEEDAEEDDELDTLYDIVDDIISNIPGESDSDIANITILADKLKEYKYDYDELLELWGEADELHESIRDSNLRTLEQMEEDGYTSSSDDYLMKNSEKKRKRKQFDEEDGEIDEIKFEQKQTDLILPKRRFGFLVKEILQDFGDNKLTISNKAIEALQISSEAFLIDYFNKTNENAIHGMRTHINRTDSKKARNDIFD